MSRISIFKVNNAFIIKKNVDDDFFYTTSDSFIIPTFNFSAILKFMLFRELLSPKILEGVLEEYYNKDK